MGTVNLSNMPAVSDETLPRDGATDQWLSEKVSSSGEKWKMTRFEKTPLMSTYVVAYANGHFRYLEGSYTSPLSGKTRPLRTYGEQLSVEFTQTRWLKHAPSYGGSRRQAQVRTTRHGKGTSLV